VATIAFKEFSLLSLLQAPELSETSNSIFFIRLVSQYFFGCCNFHELYRVFTHRRKIFQTSMQTTKMKV